MGRGTLMRLQPWSNAAAFRCVFYLLTGAALVLASLTLTHVNACDGCTYGRDYSASALDPADCTFHSVMVD